MAKFICRDCGCEFDEFAHWEEPRGEFWGIPCSEPMCGCPDCRSSEIDEIEEVDEDDYNDEELDG